MRVSQVLGIMFILTLALAVFVNNHLPFILISIVSLFIGIRQFVKDRKELKSAIYYSRVKIKRIPIWKRIGSSILLVGIIVAVFLTKKHFKIVLFETDLYYPLVLLASIYANHYSKFVNSIRSFDEGIMLPGRSQELISWKSIEGLSLESSRVMVQISQTASNIKIDDRDQPEANSIIRTWEERMLLN